MHILLALAFMLTSFMPPSVFIHVEVAQHASTITARFGLLILQTGQVRADVSTDADLMITVSEMDHGRCTETYCYAAVHAGDTLVMTTTATLLHAGEHFVIVMVKTPDGFGTSGGLVFNSSYQLFLPIMESPALRREWSGTALAGYGP